MRGPRNDADPLLGLQRLAYVEHVPAKHECFTLGRGQQTGEHLIVVDFPAPLGPRKP